MKKIVIPFLILCILVVVSCTKETILTMEQEQQLLNEKLIEIETIAESVSCSEVSVWEITPIGSKACGGPTGYIAYSYSINEVNFLNLVSNYTQEQNQFNLKWGIISDCSVPPMPIGVECSNNQPVFIYL